MWAIITGSGLSPFESQTEVAMLDRKTPFGECASGLHRRKILDHDVLVLPRHGIEDECLAHEINYRANFFALKRYGATKILSLSSVMSLTPKYKIGDLVAPNQYLNFTHRDRAHTFCGQGVVGYVSLTKPVSSLLLSRLHEIIPQVDFTMHLNAHYVCVDGPQSPTQLEAKRYQDARGEIVGFSHYPEYALAREAGIAYLPCCFVVDAILNETHSALLTPAHIKSIRAENKDKAKKLMTLIIHAFADILPLGCPEEGLQQALITKWDDLSDEHKSWLGVIIGK